MNTMLTIMDTTIFNMEQTIHIMITTIFVLNTNGSSTETSTVIHATIDATRTPTVTMENVIVGQVMWEMEDTVKKCTGIDLDTEDLVMIVTVMLYVMMMKDVYVALDMSGTDTIVSDIVADVVMATEHDFRVMSVTDSHTALVILVVALLDMLVMVCNAKLL